jgi:hypothetical protein
VGDKKVAEKITMEFDETTLPAPSGPELAAQIGRLFSGLYYRMNEKPKTIALSESFDKWSLSTRFLKQAIAKGKFPARKTGFQHHQIMLDGKAKAFAVSQELPDGSQQVVSVQISTIAERIDEAITHFDDIDTTDSKVRLLTIRSFSIYTFWLVDSNQVYVVSVPPRFRRVGQLQVGELISPEGLVRWLQGKLDHLKPKEDYSHRQRPRHL